MNKIKGLLKCMITICVVVLISVSCAVFSLGAESDFEKQIASFPESYKPYLRALHENHPNWSFVPFFTGLNWQTAVDNQFGKKSTINNTSDASDIYKSKAEDHFNYSTGKYIPMDYSDDGGYVAADKLAIEYYMDPRNFLNEYGIFMFEQLSFSESYDVASIETVLKGTFMYNTKISYYDSSGTKIYTEEKYSEVIYLAGKTYNVNPCYLASKIRIEVGGGTSGSITGLHSVYPGIYNFYNIGSNDGTDPVGNGLKYSSTGTTYGRPWTSPYKSIMGGAQFIASTYIAKGQDTSYLQRFNVNSDAAFPLYTHQYMTNVMATHAQVYQTYNSYKNAGLLDQEWIFSIPVFNDMPMENISGQSGKTLESIVQQGTISVSSTSSCNVRTGPSTNNSRLTTSSGTAIRLSNGTQVQILEKVKTDSNYYMYILQYPVWYKISFTYNLVQYTGYVPQSFVDISTKINVTTGEYIVPMLKTDIDADLKLVSTDVTKAVITNNNTIKFLKQGEVEVLAYDSTMNFDKLLFNVTDTDNKVKGLTVSGNSNSITVSVSQNSSAQKYGFYLTDINGKFIKGEESVQNSYTFNSLNSNSEYKVYARYVFSSAEEYGAVSCVNAYTQSNAPSKPTGLKISDITTSSHKLSWDTVDGALGYRLYRYDIEQKQYVVIGNTKNTYYETDSLTAGLKCGYRIKAYKADGLSYVYSENSDMLWAVTQPNEVQNLKVDSFTSSSCTLNWDKDENATGYNIYILNTDGTYELCKTSAVNSVSISNLNEFTSYTFCVSAYVKNYTCSAESVKSENVSVKTAFSPVENLEVTLQDYDSISLQWDKKEGFSQYEIYVFEGAAENYAYKLVSNDNSVVVTNLDPFSIYRFSVKAEKIIEGRVYGTEISEEISSETILPAVTGGFKSTNVTLSSYRISWNKSPYATSYNVFKKSGNTFEKIANVTNNYYDVKALSSMPDTYCVTAVMQADGELHESSYSTEFSATTLPDTVKNVTATVGATSAILKWDNVKNADCYNVYHYNEETKAYELVKMVTSNTMTIKGLSIGESAKYRVRAYIRTTTGTQKGGCGYVSFITKPVNISKVYVSSVTTTSYLLCWNQSTGANCYYVYKYDSATKTYKVIAKTTALYYKVTGLTPGKTEAYRILPAITKSGKLYVKGNLTAVYKFVTKPETVSSLVNTAKTTSSLTFKWDKTPYTNSYEIFIYDALTKTYILSGSTTSNTFTLKNLKSSTYYYVRVRAVRTLSGVNYYGGLSNLVKVKTK